MLASILSSAGALVELQAPCLSDSVLAHVLDYIYTGALPCTQSHQQYSNLFTAACYLKMDELQRTLESQVNHLQVSGSWTGASLESAWIDTHRGTAATSCSKAERTLQGVNTGGQITISSSRMLPNVVPAAAEMCRVFRTGTEALHYQFHSARPADPESWLQGTDTQMRTAAENKRCSAKEGETSIMEVAQQLCLTAVSGPEEAQAHRRDKQIHYTRCCVDSSSHIASPSPSSPHPSCGAVPVIRHSSAATAAEARTGPPYHLMPKVLGNNGRLLKDISTQGGARNEKQRLGYGSGSDDRAGHDSPPKSSSAEEQTHSQDPQTGLPLLLQGPDTQCLTDADRLPSAPSLTLTEEHTEDPAVVRHERDDTADDSSDRDKSQPLATFTAPVDNRCSPAFSVVEQSYHAHLHYHCLHQKDTLLSPRTAVQNHSHPDLSDRASDEDEGGPFSSAAQHFSPADQVLLLDISTKPPELLISYRYDEQADWAPLGQGTSGNHRDGEAAEAVADDSGGGPMDGDADANSNDKTPKTPGGQVKGGENYTPRCAPSCVLDSLHAPTSPTSSFCTPSAISANMPTIVSPQPSNHHPFQCSMCHRSFSQRGSLNRHMRSHLGIRPFPCPRCPMTFSRQYRVSEHMRVHQRCVLGNDFQKPPASST